PQTATDHLTKQPHLPRWAREDDAADVGAVEALGEHHAVGDDLGLAGREPRQDGLALVLERAATRCSARTPALMNSSRMWIEWPTLQAKATVRRCSPYLNQCVTISPTSLSRSIRSASCVST